MLFSGTDFALFNFNENIAGIDFLKGEDAIIRRDVGLGIICVDLTAVHRRVGTAHSPKKTVSEKWLDIL